MPRRNDISKVLVVLTSAVVLLATHAFGCVEISRPKIVGPAFSVLVTGRYGPQPNMEVTLQADSEDHVERKLVARTDSAGMATFRDVQDGNYIASTARAQMGDSWPVDVHAGGDHVTIVELTWPSRRLLRVRQIAGSMHGGGAPGPNGGLLLQNATGQNVWSGRTDRDGTFRVDSPLPPGFYELQVMDVGQEVGIISIELNEHAEAAKLDLVLGQSDCGLSFTNLEDCTRPTLRQVKSGWVHDSSGARIGSAAVTANDGVHRVTTSTDPEGKFTLDGLAPGDYEVMISAPAFTPLRATLTVDRSAIGRGAPVADVELSMLGSCSSVRARGANK